MTKMIKLEQTFRSAGRPGNRPEGGFTLVELMIAIVLGLLIVLALIAVFLNISRTNSEMAKTNSQIENARFAIQLLRDDISVAGFWGTYVPAFDDLTATGIPADAPTAIPAPCTAFTAWDAAYITGLLGIPVQSYDALPTGCATTILPDKKANTDVLVVRHAETCLPGVNGCEAETLNKLYFQSSRCENEINAGSRYVLAKKAAAVPDTTFTLKQRGCTGTPPAATTGTLAEKRKFTSSIYYIRDYARTPGDQIPTLMRSQFDLSGATPAFLAAVPLIEGIEGFRVELGVDDKSDSGADVNYAQAIAWANPNNLTSPTNRGDGIPDGAFVHCTTATPCTLGQLTNVVAVRLYLLARAEVASPDHSDTKTYNLGGAALGPFNDKFKRHVFSNTVRLTNVSGRRETP